MLNINKFISENTTPRSASMFVPDIETNYQQLQQEIEGKILLAIGGAGSIESAYIHRLYYKETAFTALSDVKYYFISLEESGLICMLGHQSKIFVCSLS